MMGPPDDHRTARFLPFLVRSEIAAIVLLWAVWASAILVFSSVALTLPVSNGSPWTAVAQAPPLARWDSVWYRSVALDGYQFDRSNPENNVGFYPLYPLVSRAIAVTLGAPLLETGIGISIVCIVPALLLMGDLFVEWGGRGAGLAGTTTLLLFPTAFFLAAFYTESMFLLFSVLTIWGARRGHWLTAGTSAGLGALTRFNGFLLLVPLALIAWQCRAQVSQRGALRFVASGIAAFGGAVAFPAYLWIRWGDLLLYVHSKMSGWPVRSAAPWTLLWAMAREAWQHLRMPTSGDGFLFFAELISGIFLIAATAALFRRRLWPEAAWSSATLLLLLTSGTHSGWALYAVMFFPCFHPLAESLRRRPALAASYAFCGTGSGLILLHRYVHWIFVG